MDSVLPDRGVMVVVLEKQYDSLNEESTRNLDATLRELAEAAVPTRVLLDMSHTSAIGSTFLAAVFAAERRLRSNKGHLALCSVSPFCAEVLDIVKAERVFKICQTREEGINELLKQVPASGATT